MERLYSISNTYTFPSKGNNSHIIDLQDKLSMNNFKAKALADLVADDEFSLFAQDTQHGCLLALRELVAESVKLSEQLWNNHSALLKR